MNTTIMEETRRNSMKLDFEAVRLSENDHDQPTETYKQVSEFDTNDKSTAVNMTRDKSENIEDGADEKMLGTDEKEQLARKDEVKFITSSNGDAKIDIGNIEKTIGGMTKEELMKYANDPFWQRLRWTFFILFWALWVAMLAGAIWIILKAPKCSAPRELEWYKEGPLVAMPQVNFTHDDSFREKLHSVGAKGVIYNLPADKTYSIEGEVERYIKELVKDFNATEFKLILDLTPNYVTTENELFKSAKAGNETIQHAFIWKHALRQPNNYISKVPNTRKDQSAWHAATQDNYALSQFGDNNIDLQLNHPIAKDYFKNVLTKLLDLGVNGFRLANAKHYIVDTSIPDDTAISDRVPQSNHVDYDFWTHKATTNQPGLDVLLNEFSNVVSNKTNRNGLLTVSDYIERREVFALDKRTNFGFDLPIVVNLTSVLLTDSSDTAKKLYERLNASNPMQEGYWPQILASDEQLNRPEYYIFLFMLPGVPVLSYNNIKDADNATLKTIQTLVKFRSDASYKHGSFNVHTDINQTVIAYSRLKSGSPGFFVVYNPTNANVTVDLSSIDGLPDQLSVMLTSQNPFATETKKVSSKSIELQAKSSVLFQYAKS